jgi:hypothetical protein
MGRFIEMLSGNMTSPGWRHSPTVALVRAPISLTTAHVEQFVEVAAQPANMLINSSSAAVLNSL